MSYGLQLVRLPADADPRTVDAEYVESLAGAPGPVQPAEEAHMQTLSAALRALNPALRAADIHIPAGAGSSGGWRAIELNGPERGSGIQILLFATGASITIPYWHAGDAAHSAWKEIWSYLHLLESEGGLRAWDPQIEAVLSLRSDLEIVLDTYVADVLSITPGLAEPRTVPEPWWRFWKRGRR